MNNYIKWAFKAPFSSQNPYFGSHEIRNFWSRLNDLLNMHSTQFE